MLELLSRGDDDQHEACRKVSTRGRGGTTPVLEAIAAEHLVERPRRPEERFAWILLQKSARQWGTEDV